MKSPILGALTVTLAMTTAFSAQNHAVLSDDQVAKFANLALDGITREYPNKPSNVMADASSVLSPRVMHPVFYGSFDWHSAVHGHWMLIRLLRLYPEHKKLRRAALEPLGAHAGKGLREDCLLRGVANVAGQGHAHSHADRMPVDGRDGRLL